MQLKVGIITFHRAHNYGAVLQCYALSEYLKSVGCEVEVIDYYPKVFREEYASFPMAHFRRASILEKRHILVSYFRNYPYIKERNKIFDHFLRNEIKLSSVQYDDKNHHIEGYDYIFFGSDQIWNPKLTGGFDDVFTGNFNKGKTMFVSYAASTMMDSVDMNNKDFLQVYQSILKRFDMVSVREKVFADYLNSLQIREVEHVIDPVLLLNAESWNEISIRPKEECYVLTYSVPRTPVISNKAKDIADGKGMKLIEIAPNGRLYIDGEYKKIISPKEYVGFFQYADFIVTSSFHGTAFSVIYRKPFVLLLKGNSYDVRAYGLLEELNLTERAITLDSKQFSLDYLSKKSIDIPFSKIKEKSEKYIKRALSELIM